MDLKKKLQGKPTETFLIDVVLSKLLLCHDRWDGNGRFHILKEQERKNNPERTKKVFFYASIWF